MPLRAPLARGFPFRIRGLEARPDEREHALLLNQAPTIGLGENKARGDEELLVVEELQLSMLLARELEEAVALRLLEVAGAAVERRASPGEPMTRRIDEAHRMLGVGPDDVVVVVLDLLDG